MRVESFNLNQVKDKYSNIGREQSNNVNFKGHSLIKSFKDPSYAGLINYVYKLTNGQTVVVVPKKGPGVLSVKTVVKTGALNEIERLRGISHFMEHLAFDGSKKGVLKKGLKPGGFNKIASSMGAGINAHTSTDLTAYFFSIAGAKKKELDKLMQAHATMIKYPALPKCQYKKEQGVVIQEIKQYLDEPDEIAEYIVYKNLLGADIKASHWILGDESNIRNATRNDVLTYHGANYSPENMETYVVGDINPERAVSLVDKYFDTPDFRPKNLPRIHEKITPIMQTKIAFLSDPKIKTSLVKIGFLGPKISEDIGTTAIKALIDILINNKSSRYSRRLLSLDTAAGVNFGNLSNNPQAPSSMVFNIVVQPGGEQKVLDAFKDALQELKVVPIKQEELDVFKTNMLDKINRESESSESISDALENFATNTGIEGYEKQVENIKNLTLADIKNVSSYLDVNKSSVVIMQPEDAINKNISFTGSSLVTQKFISKKILPNGIRMVVNDNPNTIRSAIGFKVESTIPVKTGVVEVLINMLSRATAHHTEEELDLIKAKSALGDISTEAISNGLFVSITSVKESMVSAMKLVKETLFTPRMTESNFETAKREVLLGAQSSALSANDRAIELLYGNHYLGANPRKLRAELNNVSFIDVQDYYKKLFFNPRITVSLTGPISQVEGLRGDVTSELKSINKSFNKFNLVKVIPEPISKTKIALQLEKGRTQSEIIQVFHIQPENVQDIAALDVLDFILGSGGLSSRMFKDLREKQELAYHVGSGFSPIGKFAQLKLVIKTEIYDGDVLTNNIEKSLIGFEKHLKKFLKTLPLDSEINTAKRGLRTIYIKNFDDANSQNAKVLKSLDTEEGFAYYNKLLASIEKVTPEDVRKVARKYLSKPSVISVLTTEEAAQKSESFLKARGEFKLYRTESEKT